MSSNMKWKRKTLLNLTGIFLFVVLVTPTAAGRNHLEKWYQNQWCAGRGQAEYKLLDGSFCDCLTESHAIEVDFANKFQEAIGQSLYYSLLTSKRAGVLLILEDKSDLRYWHRLNSVILHFDLPIATWAISTGGFKIP